jgi:hypothetical protein
MLRSLAVASLTLMVSLPGAAQMAGARHAPPRAHFDYFVSRYAQTQPIDGLGARLMWRMADEVAPLGARLWGGVYLANTGRREGLESWRAGAQADAALLRAPGLPLDGLLSVSAGVVRVRQLMPDDAATPPSGPAVLHDREAAAPRRTLEDATGFSLAPGVAARLGLARGAGVRADVRRIWDLGAVRSATTELSAGVSLPL